MEAGKTTDYYPITGIPTKLGQKIPARQEVAAWYNNPSNKYEVSLFMQAMTEFKAFSINDTLSYFQIAGIFKLASHLFLRYTQANSE